jgi:hypothetical protein
VFILFSAKLTFTCILCQPSNNRTINRNEFDTTFILIHFVVLAIPIMFIIVIFFSISVSL